MQQVSLMPSPKGSFFRYFICSLVVIVERRFRERLIPRRGIDGARVADAASEGQKPIFGPDQCFERGSARPSAASAAVQPSQALRPGWPRS